MFDFVIIVLTYRNIGDLKAFFENIKKISGNLFKVIVVNSFYDNNTLNEFEKIAYENNSDFISVENKGYGYGNNMGIKYAKENYKFNFLIISNPDIDIRKFNYKKLKGFENEIIAPRIKTLTGKNQNPYYYKKINLVQYLKYKGCKTERNFYNYLGIIINKINREMNLFLDKINNRKIRKIYACHGSFIIFGYGALDKLGTIFDERMFLFAEEEYLAAKAKEKGIDIYMNFEIEVIHKEDGSIKLLNANLSNIARESFRVYYENYKE